ncbi:MAG: methyltransferase [Steroidobacteraceae bacterium]|jgi:predicted methyltransferase|nr:methyltransferase [Steroidobacteraceae bacterium]
MSNPLRHAPLAAALALATALAGCTTTGGTAGPEAAASAAQAERATAEAIDRALAGAHRSEANRARDRYRNPKETLQFFGLRQDMTVMEVWPGAGGWYTEVLAPVLRDRGRYVAAGWDPKSEMKFIQDSNRAFQTKLDSNPEVYGKVQVAALQAPNALTPVPPGTVDLVLTFRNLHNWMAREEMAPAMLKAIHDALKPGGVLGVVDHRADPKAPVDPRAKSGYVNERHAIELIEAAGFEFVGSSEVNANPKDTRDHEQGVWTLPPTLRLGDRDRARYLAIGESDRFTLKFRKPVAAKK